MRGRPARIFKEITYRTLHSWSRSRRAVAKAEHLENRANPRSTVTSLMAERIGGQPARREDFYCGDAARWRTASRSASLISMLTARARRRRAPMSCACGLLRRRDCAPMEAVWRLALAGTDRRTSPPARSALKLQKIGAVVTVSVRRDGKLAFTSACPAKVIFALAVERLAPPAPAAGHRRRGATPPPTEDEQQRIQPRAACPSRQTWQPSRTPTAGNPQPNPAPKGVTSN